MDVKTHRHINPTLCGRPLRVEKERCEVELVTISEMEADVSGLVHGGFIFGLADYAAMIAVNHQNVVLGGADVNFFKPVRSGETLMAKAEVVSASGKKQIVSVQVFRGEEIIFQGEFTCFVLDRHVLDIVGEKEQ
jgi:uncharacterized protein (TIGR00369 family)